MERLRRPFLIAAIVLMVIVVLVEIGASVVMPGTGGDLGEIIEPGSELDTLYDDIGTGINTEDPPGRAIPYMALVDGILLLTVGLMGLSLLIGEERHARIQGCITAVVALLVILGAIGLLIVTIITLILMVSLFLAVPFGTLIYLAQYGFFNRGGASVALSLLLLLKIGFAVCLFLAHQRFLQNIGLVLLTLTSLVANVIISFLHGLVPVFLVSITDAVAAIIVDVLACVWAIVLLIGAIIAILKAIRPEGVGIRN